MKNTLVVGCSYVQSLGQKYIAPGHYFQFTGQPAAGNTLIAQILLDELSRKDFDRVVVLWSGVKRIDIPVSEALAKFAHNYSYIRKINDTIWVSSGGEAGSWLTQLPRDIERIFKSFYIGTTLKQYADTSLSNIILAQGLLKARNIDYYMSFIYDTTVQPEDPNDLAVDQCFGYLDTSSNLYNLVDWEKFKTIDKPLYNWARDNNCLLEDRIHLDPQATKKWLRVNFGLEL